MIWKTWLSASVRIVLNEASVIKFDDGKFELSLIPQNEIDLEQQHKRQTFNIIIVKGVFEITGIESHRNRVCLNADKKSVYFETCNNTFSCSVKVTTNIQYNKTGYVCVPYNMLLTTSHMNFLEIYDFNEGIITLPYYSTLKFKYYVKRISKYHIEVIVENPYDIKINGRNGDFTYEQTCFEDINLTLSFEFDPNVLQELKNVNSVSALNDLKNDTSENTINFPTMFDIMSDPKYADVILLSVDQIEVPSSRSILAKYSTIFTKLFDETTELPAKIKIDNFKTETIVSALKLCFGKHEIIHEDTEIFQFINKYAISPLSEECSKQFDDSVNIENVCDIIQIAYLNKFEFLKQKCLKLLSETKMAIPPTKFKELPKDILVDMLYV